METVVFIPPSSTRLQGTSGRWMVPPWAQARPGEPAPLCNPGCPFPFATHGVFCYRKVVNCMAKLKRSQAVPAPIPQAPSLLALLHLLPELSSCFSVHSSHLILSHTWITFDHESDLDSQMTHPPCYPTRGQLLKPSVRGVSLPHRKPTCQLGKVCWSGSLRRRDQGSRKGFRTPEILPSMPAPAQPRASPIYLWALDVLLMQFVS